MTRFLLRSAGLAALLASGPALAQATNPASPPTAPVPTSPGAATPPNGVARGVISPSKPVDPQMVTKPGPQTKNTMPVITPPGTAR